MIEEEHTIESAWIQRKMLVYANRFIPVAGLTSHEESSLRTASRQSINKLLGVLIWTIVICQRELSWRSAFRDHLSRRQSDPRLY